jgi:hypothetical protein
MPGMKYDIQLVSNISKGIGRNSIAAACVPKQQEALQNGRLLLKR